MTTPHVLVVEDDPDGQEVLTAFLSHHAIETDAVESAEAALHVLGQRQFTAVVIDLALPNMDGWTLLQHIQNNPSLDGIPCIAITAFHSADVGAKAIRAGFHAYFPKPFSPQELVDHLKGLSI